MTPDPLQRFDEALRRWSHTPPKTPAREAAEAVARRLESSSAAKSHPARPWLRAAAVLAAAGALAFWLGRPAPVQPSPAVAALLPEPLPATLPENVALIWLDTETPLYLTLPELNLE